MFYVMMKSFIIYNLYRDSESIYFRFATVDDIPSVIRENRNKKIDNILNGK
jgi:reverse gyrase